MDILYVDELFLLNGLADYLLLLSAARLRGLPLRRGRFLLGGIIGGAYAVAVAIPGWIWLGALPCRLLAAAGMALAAYGARRGVWKDLLAFLGLSGAYAGAVYAAALLAGQTGPGLLVPVSLRILVLSFALCYAVIRWVFPAVGKQRSREIFPVTVAFGGREITVHTLRDTGNALRDPVSGLEVMILDPREAKRLLPLLPPELLSAPGEAMALLAAVYGPERFRLLPYSAVGQQGLLLCLRPDTLTADGRRGSRLVGLSPTPVGGADYRGIW